MQTKKPFRCKLNLMQFVTCNITTDPKIVLNVKSQRNEVTCTRIKNIKKRTPRQASSALNRTIEPVLLGQSEKRSFLLLVLHCFRKCFYNFKNTSCNAYTFKNTSYVQNGFWQSACYKSWWCRLATVLLWTGCQHQWLQSRKSICMALLCLEQICSIRPKTIVRRENEQSLQHDAT